MQLKLAYQHKAVYLVVFLCRVSKISFIGNSFSVVVAAAMGAGTLKLLETFMHFVFSLITESLNTLASV